MQEFLSEITIIKFLTLDVVEISVSLSTPEDVEFKAGQGMELRYEGKPYNLTMAGPPLENNKVLTFCFSAGKSSPLQPWVKNLKVGDKVTLLGPVGDFTIPSVQVDLLLMAEKTGITPFTSIVPDLLATDYEKNIKLLFQVQSEDEMFHFAHFSRLAANHPNFTFTPIVVRPFSHWPGEVGTITTFVQVFGKNFIDSSVYISGHKEFVEAVAGEWHKIKMDKKDIYKNIVPPGL